MTLPPGSRLGRYEIISMIGAGGMGEVYRARDPHIGRDVAIKVLPSTVVADPDRLRRFQQEAQAAGALNHPNLLSIFDIGVEGKTPYVVSELLEGENLRERIDGSALPIRLAADYARQIAAGLAAAHDKGIVHRDLKPENAFVCGDGRVKLLDFGLAKLMAPSPLPASAVAPAAVSTSSGVIVGTTPYMAPEQIRGQPIDHRTDIFSFGAMLYEMLAGARPYGGESAADTMTAILNSDPAPLEERRPDVPGGLVRVVARCLQKNPAHRFQSAHDLGFTLETVSGTTGSGAGPARTRTRTISSGQVAWIVAACALLAIAAMAARSYFSHPVAPSAATVAFEVPAPEGSSFATLGLSGGPFAISPDGHRLALAAPDARGRNVLWVRSLDSVPARALAGTQDASFPFWSPDGRTIAFFANDRLKTVSADGGLVVDLANAPGGAGGAWSAAGVIVFLPNRTGPLYQVAASGGDLKPATVLDQGRHEVAHRWPCFLPDGRHFLYSTQMFLSSPSADDGVYVGSLDDGSRKLVLRQGTNVAYSDGFLLFMRGTLVAQPFDTDRLELTGQPAPVAERVQGDPLGARFAFTASPNGVLAYKIGPQDSDYQLTWKDRAGRSTGTVGEPGLFGSPAISPDGMRIAVQTLAGTGARVNQISVYDLARKSFEIATPDTTASHRTGVWSPDGTRLLYSATHKGPANLYQISLDAGTPERLVAESPADKYARSWSSDGKYLVFHELHPVTKGDLWVKPMSEDGKPWPYLRTPANELNGQFSPDGRWVAYESDEAGRSEIYVSSFPEPTIKRQISAAGGRSARWRLDEIFYHEPSNRLMAVHVAVGSGKIDVGSPQALFSAYQTGPGYFYDAAPDGQRFIVNDLRPDKVSLPLTVVVNWRAAIK